MRTLLPVIVFLTQSIVWAGDIQPGTIRHTGVSGRSDLDTIIICRRYSDMKDYSAFMSAGDAESKRAHENRGKCQWVDTGLRATVVDDISGFVKFAIDGDSWWTFDWMLEGELE